MPNTSKYDVDDNRRPIAVRINDGSEIGFAKTDDDKSFQEQQLDMLGNINATLKMILNHQRIITGIEEEKGDNF